MKNKNLTYTIYFILGIIILSLLIIIFIRKPEFKEEEERGKVITERSSELNKEKPVYVDFTTKKNKDDDSKKIQSVVNEEDVYEHAKKEFERIKEDAKKLAEVADSVKDTYNLFSNIFKSNSSINS